MGARSESCSIIPVVIVESNILYQESLCSWTNDTMWINCIELPISIISSSNHDTSIDLSHLVSKEISLSKLNTREHIICSLEVDESDISYLLSNSSISLTLPSYKVFENGSDWWVLPVWVGLVGWVVHNWLTRVLSWNHVVEQS